MMTTQIDTLEVVRSEASALIRDEIRAGRQRAQFERAIWDSVNSLGRTIDEVSEASGLPPDQVRRIASGLPDLESGLLPNAVA